MSNVVLATILSPGCGFVMMLLTIFVAAGIFAHRNEVNRFVN